MEELVLKALTYSNISGLKYSLGISCTFWTYKVSSLSFKSLNSNSLASLSIKNIDYYFLR